MRVAAVVPTYNRKELLLKCLQGILRQSRPVDAIILVDNASPDGTSEMLRNEGYCSDLIHYIHLKENIGSAGGYLIGLKYAYEHGYDWFWLMDDDAVPSLSALENLLWHSVEHQSKTLGGLISYQTSWTIGCPRWRLPKSIREAFTYCLFCPIEITNECLIPIDHCSLVCFLVPCIVVSRVGFPRVELYFYADDFDYTLRIRKSGYRLFLVIDSLVDHQSGLFIKNKVNMNASLRYYYLYRNNIATIITHRRYIGIHYAIVSLIRISCGAAKKIFLSCAHREFKLAILVLKAIISGYALHLGKYASNT